MSCPLEEPKAVVVEGPRAVVELYGLQLTSDGNIQVEPLDAIETTTDVALSFADLNGQDVNGDGLKELVVETWTGGSCRACDKVRLFHVSQRRLKELSIPVREDVIPKSLVDLDSDGQFEVIALDTEWEGYGMFCKACAPRVEVVYAWQSGQYIEASHRFPHFYTARIAELEQRLQSPADDQSYASDAISLLLNYIRKGEAAQGWQRFQTLTSPIRFKDPAWAEEAQGVAAKLGTRFQLE